MLYVSKVYMSRGTKKVKLVSELQSRHSFDIDTTFISWQQQKVDFFSFWCKTIYLKTT